jgi:hypothetical protein
LTTRQNARCNVVEVCPDLLRRHGIQAGNLVIAAAAIDALAGVLCDDFGQFVAVSRATQFAGCYLPLSGAAVNGSLNPLPKCTASLQFSLPLCG